MIYTTSVRLVSFCMSKKLSLSQQYQIVFRGGSRTTAAPKMERFVIIVNGLQPLTVITYHKALHLGCCSSPRFASIYLIAA